MAEEDFGTVVTVGTDLWRVVDEGTAALKNADALFQRAGTLVHVVGDGRPPSGVLRAEGAPSIRPIQPATLRAILSRVASWQRFDKRSEEMVETLPPDPVVAAIAQQGHWPGVPHLVGVIQSPAMRPDGTIIDKPGYDATTGYLYLPGCVYPDIPSTPTQADALAARDELLAVVADFPFAKPEHRAAWLGALLTLFARPAVDGCVPLVAVDATTRGTGKGKLIDATAIIATGRDATKTPMAEHDAEMRKRITSLVVEGEQLACIDNVAGKVELPSLDAAVTASRWKDRILGRTATAEAPNLILWTITGNNLEFGGDMSRRVLHVRLESPVERPEDRDDFTHRDLLGWVRAERPRLVRAALVILRAYFVAGCPDMGCKPWGSFEAWSRLIANACVWIGLPDPMRTRAELESSADSAKSALVALLDGWQRLGAITAKEAISQLYPTRRYDQPDVPDGYDELREAVETLAPPQPGKPPTSKALGLALRRVRRRVVGGRMLDAQSGHGGVVRWHVISSRPTRDGGDGGDGGLPTTLRGEIGRTDQGVGVMANPPHPPSPPEAVNARSLGSDAPEARPEVGEDVEWSLV
jgi:hypothetical protein